MNITSILPAVVGGAIGIVGAALVADRTLRNTKQIDQKKHLRDDCCQFSSEIRKDLDDLEPSEAHVAELWTRFRTVTEKVYAENPKESWEHRVKTYRECLIKLREISRDVQLRKALEVHRVAIRSSEPVTESSETTSVDSNIALVPAELTRHFFGGNSVTISTQTEQREEDVGSDTSENSAEEDTAASHTQASRPEEMAQREGNLYSGDPPPFPAWSSDDNAEPASDSSEVTAAGQVVGDIIGAEVHIETIGQVANRARRLRDDCRSRNPFGRQNTTQTHRSEVNAAFLCEQATGADIRVPRLPLGAYRGISGGYPYVMPDYFQRPAYQSLATATATAAVTAVTAAAVAAAAYLASNKAKDDVQVGSPEMDTGVYSRPEFKSASQQSPPHYSPRQHGLQCPPRQHALFLRGERIDREVITADICIYLGHDALVRPETYQDPSTGQLMQGYHITGYADLTLVMIPSLEEDSARWDTERNARTGLRASARYPGCNAPGYSGRAFRLGSSASLPRLRSMGATGYSGGRPREDYETRYHDHYPD